MSNRISLLSLVENKSAFISHAQARIVESISSYFPDAGNFEMYSGQKEMFAGLSNAFSKSEIIIAGVESSLYLSFKKALLQVLNLESETNSGVLGTISKNDEDAAESLSLAHAAIPKGSAIFVSEDGYFPGFAKKSGKQHLIFLPLDPGRTDSIIENGFQAYIKQISAGKSSTGASAYANENAAKALNALQSSGFRVAVASTKSSAFIKTAYIDVPGYENSFSFISCNEEKNAASQKEFIAGLARQAREINICSLGAAISNVFKSEKDGGRLFIYVTVADSVRARVAKVFGEPGESPRQLVEAAVDTLLNMLTEYSKSGGFDGYPDQETDTESPPAEVKTKKKLALWIILSVIAALFICFAMIFIAVRAATAEKDKSKDTLLAKEKFTISQNSEGTMSFSEKKGNPAYVFKNNVSAASTSAASTTASEPLIITTLTSILTTGSITTVVTKPAIITTKAPVTTTKAAVTTTKAPVTTTKAPVTTTKVPVTTTKAPVTTTKAPETATEVSTTVSNSTGTFSFTVKGYGHGVGMSQEGAIAYAINGWSYDKILLHYYRHDDLTLKDDTAKPDSVKYGGESIPLGKYLAGTTAAEIGAGAPIEALKAQVVAAYTYAKSNKFILSTGQHAYNKDFDFEKSSNVKTAVTEAAGKYLSYNGSVASAPYFAESAGKTASAASVWGSDKYPYLSGGIVSPEEVSTTYETFTSDEIKNLVAKYNDKSISTNDITLSGDPSEWIQIIACDSAGYVGKIQVGDQVITGNTFRYYLLESGIRSHCFAFTYSPD